jgi:hypothetical protein
MSKEEILASIQNLSVAERAEVLSQLLPLEEQQSASTPVLAEAALLDQELADYEADPGAVTPWAVVEQRLRNQK